MPINFGTNSYSGEVLEDLLLYTAQGNDTFQEGLIHIKSGIQHKYTLPSIKLGEIIQDNKPTPTSTEGGGTGDFNKYSFSERYLEPQEFMVYQEFNPRDYEKYYKFAQPTGNLVFRELDPKIQATMLRLLMEKKDEYIGTAIWTGAKGGAAAVTADKIVVPALHTALGAGKEKYFDGAIKRMLDNLITADPNEIATGTLLLAGSTAIDTGAKVEAALYAMFKKCPTKIRKKSSLVFITSWEVWDLYDQFLSDKQVKYSDNTQTNQYRFKGKRIIPIVGVPENTIILGEFSTGMESNLWMGVDYANDADVLKVDQLQSNSELYFFQMRMKMDVNIVRPAEIVLWTTYSKTLV